MCDFSQAGKHVGLDALLREPEDTVSSARQHVRLSAVPFGLAFERMPVVAIAEDDCFAARHIEVGDGDGAQSDLFFEGGTNGPQCRPHDSFDVSRAVRLMGFLPDVLAGIGTSESFSHHGTCGQSNRTTTDAARDDGHVSQPVSSGCSLSVGVTAGATTEPNAGTGFVEAESLAALFAQPVIGTAVEPGATCQTDLAPMFFAQVLAALRGGYLRAEACWLDRMSSAVWGPQPGHQRSASRVGAGMWLAGHNGWAGRR